MKNNFLKYIFSGIGVLAAASSCSVDVMDDLKGEFEAPVVVAADKLVSQSAEKVDGKKVFTLVVSDGKNTLDATLIGKDYFLTSNTYTGAAASAAKNGNFVLGQTKVNDKEVASGRIKIVQDGSHYTLSSVLFLTDGTPYKISWAGDIVYEAEIEAVHLVKVLSAQSNLANGQTTLSMQLATDGVDMTQEGWTTTYSGDGNYLALDIYSADGYLHEGTYKPCAVGGTVGAGEYGIGYDTEFWGMQMYNWGTCWWTVENGTTSAVKVLAGDITVKKNGSAWTIEMNNDVAWCKFEGEIPALTGEA